VPPWFHLPVPLRLPHQLRAHPRCLTRTFRPANITTAPPLSGALFLHLRTLFGSVTPFGGMGHPTLRRRFPGHGTRLHFPTHLRPPARSHFYLPPRCLFFLFWTFRDGTVFPTTALVRADTAAGCFRLDDRFATRSATMWINTPATLLPPPATPHTCLQCPTPAPLPHLHTPHTRCCTTLYRGARPFCALAHPHPTTTCAPTTQTCSELPRRHSSRRPAFAGAWCPTYWRVVVPQRFVRTCACAFHTYRAARTTPAPRLPTAPTPAPRRLHTTATGSATFPTLRFPRCWHYHHRCYGDIFLTRCITMTEQDFLLLHTILFPCCLAVSPLFNAAFTPPHTYVVRYRYRAQRCPAFRTLPFTT